MEMMLVFGHKRHLKVDITLVFGQAGLLFGKAMHKKDCHVWRPGSETETGVLAGAPLGLESVKSIDCDLQVEGDGATAEDD